LALVARDPYIFDCLKLQDDARGRALEHALIDDIQRFLLELGSGVRVLRPSDLIRWIGAQTDV
jgi:predicted nuclease of restriction endonuclease-like (RecB) superfamily